MYPASPCGALHDSKVHVVRGCHAMCGIQTFRTNYCLNLCERLNGKKVSDFTCRAMYPLSPCGALLDSVKKCSCGKRVPRNVRYPAFLYQALPDRVQKVMW